MIIIISNIKYRIFKNLALLIKFIKNLKIIKTNYLLKFTTKLFLIKTTFMVKYLNIKIKLIQYKYN